jgi:hypothetical protein
MTTLNVNQVLDPDTGEITSTLAEKPRVNPPKILHRYGFLESNTLSDVANTNHGKAVNGHAGHLAIICGRPPRRAEKYLADQLTSPAGKRAKAKELTLATKANLQKMTDKHADAVDYQIGKIQQDIPDDVWKPKTVPEMMDAREIRDHIRDLDKNARLGHALVAARAGDDATTSAIRLDPIHGGNLLSDGAVAKVVDVWKRARFKKEFENLDAGNEARGTMLSNCATAIKTLPQTM